MRAACRAKFSEDGLVRQECYHIARTYYRFVWAGAGGAYEDAQTCLRDALSDAAARAEARLDAFIGELRARSRDLRDRGENAATAAALARQAPALERLAIDEDMASLRASTNEIAIYMRLLESAAPANGTQAQIVAHRMQVTRVQEVVDELKALHDNARAAVDRELARFGQQIFETRVTAQAAAQATARFDQIDAKLDDASAALARARATRGGIGIQAPANPTELNRTALLANKAKVMVDTVTGHVHAAIIQALANELSPLRAAKDVSRRALDRAMPIYARGRNLVGRPLYTVDRRPPPPGR